jgi:hypothetical protein
MLFCLITKAYAIAKWKYAITVHGPAIRRDRCTNGAIICALKEYPEAIKEEGIALEKVS